MELQQNDPYLNMIVGIQQGDNSILDATVKRRVIDNEGVPVGVPHHNPMLNTRRYHVQYPDGSEEVMSANLIAENMLSQVDEDGQRQMLFDEIIGHRVGETQFPRVRGLIRQILEQLGK